jgi:sialate O-acetylesterase
VPVLATIGLKLTNQYLYKNYHKTKMRKFFLTLMCAFVVIVATAAPTKVACVGNSITYGFLVENRDSLNYPAQLQRLLGDDYDVRNFGKSGATLLRRGHRPYNEQDEYKAAIEFVPDIVVMHLGVNDTDPRDWPNFNSEFVNDYTTLINDFKRINPNVRVLVALLTPLHARHFRFRTGTRDWRLEIQEAIKNVAKYNNVELIDFNEPFRDRQNLFVDGIHPTAEGAGVLAHEVYCCLTGNFGGLQLPEYYQSGMVLQRNQPVHIAGRADALRDIKVTLNGQSATTKSDNTGHWNVVLPPLATGKGYEMTVTDGTTNLKFTDIMAGELWIASGQSNMEFTLNETIGGRETVANCADPLIRIYDMKPVARTNAEKWSDEVIYKIDHNQHYLPTKWQTISPENAGRFSAVAYYFAKSLRDSLENVPIGIISNAVGGSNTESWTDVNTLEMGMPEILVNWQGNDYVQPWCQQRAKENIGEKRPLGRHPYEPSYLYSNGIRQFEGISIAGVIWYQGESNAHNIEVHEGLFKLLTQSWRKAFNNDKLPFYFVQLCGINRPSWPQFRDSQRRLADSLDNVYMTVITDVADSLNVHPRNKRPVGERLARQALKYTYGHTSLSADGPRPLSAKVSGNTVTVSFSDAADLHTNDAKDIRSFELAEIDGFYYPATATVAADGQVAVTSSQVSHPRYVRYAWEPFTRANLVNGAGLLTSTFKLEVDNAADYDVETGYEYGVSAAFGANINGDIIVAGGANFPENPLAADSKKHFYNGIYKVDGTSTEKIGVLPQAIAYGATASTTRGAVLIGGSNESGSLNTVYLLNVDGDNVSISELPSLPAALDNAAAAALGNKVYVAGGNVNGKPSNQLLMLDLDAATPAWRKLASMPGNARTQPAVAAANGKVYVFGGFAPKSGSKAATLNTDALCYDPAKNKWTKIAAPTTATGTEISLGGGTAATLGNGKIVALGGVNKDIFLQALQNQPADYLQHNPEWYQFNDNVLVFDASTNTWSIGQQSSDTARAGAVAVPFGANKVYVHGGEVKPRIRTAHPVILTL